MPRKNEKMLYEAIFEYADDGITVTFPDFPGCITCGRTEEEALAMAKDALFVYIKAFGSKTAPSPLPADFPAPSDGIKVFFIEHDTV